jgi:hypothetical protein
MFQLQRTPCGFTLGRITPLHKGGCMCQAGNYCPIALLNSDYKVLARVLAERFGQVMLACIGAERTAYLPGREIGDSVSSRNWLQRTCPKMGSVGPWSCWILPRFSTPVSALFFMS